MRPPFGVALVLAALPAALLPARALALDAQLDLSLQSAYVWRGMVLNDRPVFQPSLTVSAGPLSASVWTNVDLTSDHGHRGETSEIDYWLAYTFAGNDAELTVTCYDYTFPHATDASTQEVWATVTLKTLPFSPSLSAIRDVNAVDGWYFLLTGSQPLGLLKTGRSGGLLLTLNLGHGDRDYAAGYFPDLALGGVTDYGVRLDWPVKLGPGTLTLDAQYTGFTDKRVDTPGFDHVAGGLTYSLEF